MQLALNQVEEVSKKLIILFKECERPVGSLLLIVTIMSVSHLRLF